MSEELNIELCPETGICSILRQGSSKVDLMPDEVEALRKAEGDPAAIRQILAGADGSFASQLAQSELDHIGQFFA